MSIPIANIFYMLCYAWDSLIEANVVNVGAIKETDLPNLFGRVLSSGFDHLTRRGLDRGYIELTLDDRTVRGRINLADTIKRDLLPNGLVCLTTSELTYDVSHNQILKATMKSLLRSPSLDPVLKHKIAGQLRTLDAIADIRLRRSDFRRVQLHSNNRAYRLLLHVCEFWYESNLPLEGGIPLSYQDFHREDRAMRLMFQKFLFNFYKHHLRAFEVTAKSFYWYGLVGTDESILTIPKLQTDVFIDAVDRMIIIDAKFAEHALESHPHSSKRTLSPAYINQLFAYMTNAYAWAGYDKSVSGLLIYPYVDDQFDIQVETHGHSIRAVSLDLTLDWQRIEKALLSFI